MVDFPAVWTIAVDEGITRFYIGHSVGLGVGERDCPSSDASCHIAPQPNAAGIYCSDRTIFEEGHEIVVNEGTRCARRV